MDSTYIFLQNYWWFIISLLAGLLVFLMFVQGGNSLLAMPQLTDSERKLLINSTGRKWEFTFTTLVTFGGAFFASFPLFYSTSFGGAYWVWMLILFTFVLQAVSYEFYSKKGNLLGTKTYRFFLILNGVAAPFLVGVAVATFFTGSEFIVAKDNITAMSMPVISQWANGLHGLEALGNGWNWILGIAVALLVQILGALYLINNLDNESVTASCRKVVTVLSLPFVLAFVAFVVFVLTKDGYAVDTATGEVYMQPFKYFRNFVEMPLVAIVFLVGVLLVLAGIYITVFKKGNTKGIWFAGAGTVLAVMGLFMCVGYNGTAYYPSSVDLQSSLTLANSSSSKFTLKTMAWVSILVPFVLAYIVYCWRAINNKKLSLGEVDSEETSY